jgi:hypothetical protein
MDFSQSEKSILLAGLDVLLRQNGLKGSFEVVQLAQKMTEDMAQNEKE